MYIHPRVDKTNAATFAIPDIARRERSAVNAGDCGDHRVELRHRTPSGRADGHPVILGLRLKIEGNPKLLINVISEIAVIALRKTSGVFSEPQNLVDRPIFLQTLTPSERRLARS